MFANGPWYARSVSIAALVGCETQLLLANTSRNKEVEQICQCLQDKLPSSVK